MKLSASVLAKLCALGVATGGCETAYLPSPNHPTQEVEPDESYEVESVDPRLETIETIRFATPPGVAPVQQTPVQSKLRPPPPPVHIDNCPACGMG